ncbi:transmembrane channel-like protein 6 isoform X2 [Chiloscyllium punctatum]|uniref:transmembrane channel-like protein 6 isoform X2 n=1 Tax=Chiloscyllium punctatum TaxID=137246 RepID=UPI003B6352CB
MAYSVDLHIDAADAIPVFSDDDLASPDSCFDEELVHNSFANLISEQSALESEPSVMIEMEGLPGTGIENVGYIRSPPRAQCKLNDDCYDPATLKVLSFMPSRTIGRSRGAIISEYYNRTLRLRRQRARPALKDMSRSMRPSIRDVAALDENCEEELEKKKLLSELQQLTGSECTRMLRTMPLNLSVKRELRRMTSNCKDHSSVPLDENLSCWSHTKYTLIIGYFTDTVLYYGYYTNNTWSILHGQYNKSAPKLPYNMPIAYIYTIGSSFFITCIILVHCLSKAFGESYRVGNTYGNLVTKVFCSWDFKMTQKQSVESNYENISTRLKESLTEHKFRATHSSITQWMENLSVHILGWILSLGSVVGCGAGIHYYSESMLKDYSQDIQQGIPEKLVESRLLTLPLIVSVINLVMPYIYNLIGLLEKYDFPQQQIYVSITRNLLLKLAILGPLCFHWMGNKLKETAEILCWETFVGQEIYRLLVVDFIFIILDTVFGEYVWRVICIKLLKRKRKPEFDIARNVLDLIFGQTLTWLGLVFVPLLPAIQMIKFLVIFYIKKLSLMKNCQPPHKLWQASHMMTIFISLLCFPSFLGATVVFSYTVWYIKPSSSCGPFRSLAAMSDSITNWVQKLDENGSKFFKYSWIFVRNPFIFFLASGFLLILIYFHCQVVDGQRKVIKLLNEQIANEGEDKKFLIDKLQDFNRKKFKFQNKRLTQREDEVYSDNY